MTPEEIMRNMPREGVFTRVLHGGSIRAGMEFEQIDGVNRDESL